MKVKKLKKLTKAQQDKFEEETVIIWNELENEATYETAIPKEWRIMEEMGILPFRQTECDRRYRIHKGWVDEYIDRENTTEGIHFR